MDLLSQIAQLQTAIVLLIAAALIAAAYILTLPVPEWHKPAAITCPLHRCPRAQCKPEWHE